MIKALWVFLGMFALDFAWAAYIKWVAQDRALRSATMAAFLMMVTGFVTVSYVNDPWMLIPVGLGAFAGTWTSIVYRKRFSNEPESSERDPQ